MQIGITNPLRTFLRWKALPPNEECDLLWCWDAHRVQLDGRVMLVLCNAANRFCCVTAMRAADWKNLSKTCIDLIQRGMLASGFSRDAVDEYLQGRDQCSFERTHGRKAVGCMNAAIDYLMILDCERSSQFQRRMTLVVNDDTCHCATRQGYGYPRTWMAEDLRVAGIEPFAMGAGKQDRGTHSGTREPTCVQCDPSDNDENARSPSMRFPADKCTRCGRAPRVFVGRVPYCLSCYNAKVEDTLGLPHFSDDGLALVAFDENGKAVEFAVERLVGPNLTSWTAREIPDSKGDKRYVGLEVGMYSELDDDPQEAFNKLWDKVQVVLSKPSTHVFTLPTNLPPYTRKDTYANNSGWGRLDVDDFGVPCIVVDGMRYTADEFFNLFSSYEGFELHWTLKDRGLGIDDSAPKDQ
ncbi:MAG: hypothetical protein IKG21_04615 [Atopobiaceae bacterium]|nr:hypothetical protein [Atopobiaceae bacterium]